MPRAKLLSIPELELFISHPTRQSIDLSLAKLKAFCYTGLTLKQNFALFFLSLTICFSAAAKTTDVFRFHLSREPHSLDPARLRGAGSSYLMNNLFRGLYRYDQDKGLLPEGAKSCQWKKSKLIICQLNEKFLWNNGKAVLAQDYVRAMRRFVNPKTRATRIDIIKNVKNALSIYKGKKAVTSLGVNAVSDFTLSIELNVEDPEFLYNLANILLVPTLTEQKFTRKELSAMNFTGPYQIKKWIKGQKIVLEENPHYKKNTQARPDVEVLFIKEDNSALTLYEKDQLDLLTRLPFILTSQYKERSDFYFRPLARFDYLGFAGKLKTIQLRKAFAQSIDYDRLAKVFQSPGRPGCPGLPLSYFDKEVCYSFLPRKARETFKNLSRNEQTQRYTFYLSQAGGDDHRQTSQILQSYWSKHLGAKIDIQQIEKKYFLKRLKAKTPDIFRKSLSLTRPTCSAALESFQKAHPANYIKLNSPELEKIYSKLVVSKDKKQKKLLCRQGIEVLMKNFQLVPMGRMHFAFLANKKFKGWKFNELNNLDLTDLKTTQ